MRSSLKPSPDRNVPTFAIWKKNGRLSVGGERSWSNWAMPSLGPPGATMSAKRWSVTSVGVRIVSNCRSSARSVIVSIRSSVSGFSLTRIVAAVAPNWVGGPWKISTCWRGSSTPRWVRTSLASEAVRSVSNGSWPPIENQRDTESIPSSSMWSKNVFQESVV
jgi:hypothetical protein